jgi:hypothetical protein
MSHDAPIACSLNADELPERLGEVRALGRDVRAVDADGTLRFGAEPATRERLEAIVAAESVCCPFLSFDLRERDGELLLTIAAPEGAEPMVRELIAAFSGAAARGL